VDPETDEGHVWLADKFQLKEYHAKLRFLGVDDRDERMFITRVLADREDLQSSKEMTREEIHAVLATLRRCQTRNDLENVVAAMHDAEV
jgi:uncharacterized protein YbgA (DUF1722 family)